MRIARSFRACAVTRALSLGALIGGTIGASSALAQRVSGITHEATAEQVVRPLVPKNLDRVVIPPLNVDELLREDAARSADGEPPRFAVPKPVMYTLDNAGTWTGVGEDGLCWQLRITSPGARSINLGFTGFELPEGAELLISTFDGTSALRPFTVDDNEEHGQLWTPVVPGDDIVVQLTVPRDMLQFTLLELGSINVGYRGFMVAAEEGRGSVDRSGSCNLDVVCGAADGWPEVDDWRDEIPGVAVISTGGSTFCTGFTVNNTAQDLTPFFMTANHCGIGSGNAPSLVCYWNYENSTCRQPNSGASGGSGNGTLSQFNTGSIFRASYSTSDMTLVELDDPINPAFEVSFLGWDRSGANATTAIGIHHPNTDEKRISFEYQSTTVTSYLGTSVPGDATHVRITDWDVGTTEPGSSGSPLFNQDHQVIGQLHGGYAACGNNDSDWYGRFYLSWTGGGTSSTRLSNWLDPLGTGQLSIDTITGAGLSVDPAIGTAHKGPVGGPFSNTPVDYTLDNVGPTSINYEVSLDGGGTAPLLINGGTSTVSGSLPGSGTTMVSISVDASAAAALPVGSYSTDVIFDDTTNGRQVVRTHTLDVGLTHFEVTPSIGLAGSGPNGGPFGQTRVYTVTSTQPNPVTVQCIASNSWISMDGGTAPVSFVLSGDGDSQQVTVGFSSAANSLSPGFYSGSVDFVNASGGTGDTSRAVTLDAGRVNISSTDTPVAITDNSSFFSYINVPDDVEIGDINVKLDISHTYIGDLIVEVQSPTGTVVRLHNRTGGSDNDIVTTYDDSTNAPDGPGLLADFNGESAMGTWTLLGSDNAGADTGALNSWTLQIGAAALPPPDCPADLDSDNDTDVFDFGIFATNFGASVTPGTNGDYDFSGTVDVLDFSVFAANFGCPY